MTPTLNQKISITFNIHLEETENQNNTNSEVASPSKVRQLEFCLTTPSHDNAPFGYVTFRSLLESLSVNEILSIFSALLQERRIIMWSKHLDKLSNCVFASVSLLYPFVWQNIFIPILPCSLLKCACAPMPFIIGIHSCAVPDILKLPLEHVILIDLDRCSVSTNAQGWDKEMTIQLDNSLLPQPNINLLQQPLQKAMRDFLERGSFSEESILIGCRQFFLSIFGTYKRYLKVDPNTQKVSFKKKLFVRKQPRNVVPFLEAFCSSQMFDKFVAEAEERAAQHIQGSTKPTQEPAFAIFDQEATRISKAIQSQMSESDSSAEEGFESDNNSIIAPIDAFYQKLDHKLTLFERTAKTWVKELLPKFEGIKQKFQQQG